MDRRIFGLGMLAALSTAGCATSKFKRYTGPEVTAVSVNKSSRRMYLLHHTDILEAYDIDLGFAPEGPKRFHGDGKTPEGVYTIDRRNPNSAFHLSIGISYPNDADRAYAAAHGKSPGGNIFIHGEPNDDKSIPRIENWTAGCIAVKDREMETIYAMVRNGTPITIHA